MVAGLGLGYGLAKAMECLPKEKARFIVAEPVEEIVAWNREFSANKAALDDPRVTVEPATAADLCRKRTGSLHAILLRHSYARCEMSLADAQAYFNALKGGSLLAITLSKRDKRLRARWAKPGLKPAPRRFRPPPKASKPACTPCCWHAAAALSPLPNANPQPPAAP